MVVLKAEGGGAVGAVGAVRQAGEVGAGEGVGGGEGVENSCLRQSGLGVDWLNPRRPGSPDRIIEYKQTLLRPPQMLRRTISPALEKVTGVDYMKKRNTHGPDHDGYLMGFARTLHFLSSE